MLLLSAGRANLKHVKKKKKRKRKPKKLENQKTKGNKLKVSDDCEL